MLDGGTAGNVPAGGGTEWPRLDGARVFDRPTRVLKNSITTVLSAGTETSLKLHRAG